MCNATTILMDDLLTIIDLIYDFCISAERLNRTARVSTSLVKPLIAGDTTDFHFFLPKSENAVFKYRPFAHLNILVLASWPSGIGAWGGPYGFEGGSMVHSMDSMRPSPDGRPYEDTCRALVTQTRAKMNEAKFIDRSV